MKTQTTRLTTAALTAMILSSGWCAPTEKIRMMAIAHRGLHTQNGLPQNSIPAFKAAYAAGAKWIETDFNALADGRIVCVHDRSALKRLSGVDKRISDLTKEDVATIDIGKSSKTAEPVHMPYLADVLACVPKDAFAQCEVKLFRSDYPERFDAAVKAAGLSESNIVVSSFSVRALADFHKIKPKYRTLWLGAGVKKGKPWDVKAAIASARAAGVNVICPNCRLAKEVGVTLAQADRVRAAGFDFRFFGVGSPELLAYAASLRATAFTTDAYPQVFEWAKALPNVEIVRELN